MNAQRTAAHECASLVLSVQVRDHDGVTSRPSPPADFPIYGLAEALWDGPRWLRFYEGVTGEAPIGIHLAHGRSVDLFQDSGPWAEVRSLPRTRFHGVTADSVRDVALDTWMSRGFGSAEDDELAQMEAGGHRDWSRVRWTLDG